MKHESLTSGVIDMATDETASAHAPVIFFDGVPSFGLNGAIANLTLEAIVFSAGNGAIVPRRVTVAHLRTSIAGLGSLAAAIDGLRLLAQPVDRTM